MIITDTFYAIKCNRCGDLHEDGDYQFYSDEYSAWESADYSEWIENHGKHYCTACYTMDVNTDECKPKPDYPKHVKEFKEVFDAIANRRTTLVELGDCFYIKHTFYKGFSKAQEECAKALLGDNLIEFKRE